MAEELDMNLGDLSFLDENLSNLDSETAQSGASDETRIHKAFLGNSCKFTMRIAWDENKKLFHTCRLYDTKIEMMDKETETMKEQRVRALARDYKDDVLQPIAEELGWQFKSKYQSIVYGKIVAIEAGEGEYFKVGWNIALIQRNKAFLDALKTAIMTIRESAPAIALGALNPAIEGICFKIDYQKGGKGKNVVCKVQADAYGPKVKFSEEEIKQFTDLTQYNVPQAGATNDANYILIENHYRKVMNKNSNYGDPTAPSDAMPPAGNALETAVNAPTVAPVVPPVVDPATAPVAPVVNPIPPVVASTSTGAGLADELAGILDAQS